MIINSTDRNIIPDRSVNVKVKPAAIWARVSTQNQAETSLPNQASRCKEKLEQAGYSVIHTFQVDWTSIDLYSCPQFQQLRELIRNREIEALAILDRDRLEAKGLQRLLFLSECKDAGVELVICQGSPILNEPEGQLIELALALGKERAVMRARQGSKDGLHDRAAKRGLPTTYHKFYGYRWDKTNNKLIPNDDWPNVKLIFDMLLDGASYWPIMKELQKRVIPSPSGMADWNKTALSAIVHNPAYAGRYFALKKVSVEPRKRKGNTYGNSSVKMLPLDQAHYMPEIEIVNPPITWEQRGRILEQLAVHQKLAQRNARRDYLLRGRIFCETHRGKSGEPRRYHGQPHHDSWRYTCPVGGCPHPYLAGPELDNWVKGIVKLLFQYKADEFYRLINKRQNREVLARQLGKELADCKAKYEKNLKMGATLEERYMNGEIDEEVYPLNKAKFKVARQAAQNRIQEIQDQLAQLGREKEAVESLVQLREKFVNKLDRLTTREWQHLLSVLGVELHVCKLPESLQEAQDLADAACVLQDKGVEMFWDAGGVILTLGIPIESKELANIASVKAEPG